MKDLLSISHMDLFENQNFETGVVTQSVYMFNDLENKKQLTNLIDTSNYTPVIDLSTSTNGIYVYKIQIDQSNFDYLN